MSERATRDDDLRENLSRTAQTYDGLPYESRPVFRSHPGRLAAVAALFGLKAAPVPSARILELGCAAGGNIIPLAAFYPDTTCLGIDLGKRQIEDGLERIAQCGLTNIELRHESITDFPRDAGEFDYIICHGVYSWVPEPVREAILDICSRHLSPTGIAYISYNVLPGWRIHQPLRDAFRALIPPHLPEPQRVQLGRQLLGYMADMTPRDDSYARLLKTAPDRLSAFDDSYLYHEYMEDVNEPFLFSDFAGAAGEFRLGYLGDAELFAMFPQSLGAEFAEKFEKSTQGDIVSSEQMIDILTGSTFRCSLLVKEAQFRQIDRNVTADRLRGLHFLGSERFTYERQEDKAILTQKDGKATTLDDLTFISVVEKLFTGIPTSVPHAELLSGFEGDEWHAAEEFLLSWVLGGAVTATVEPMVAATVSERPVAIPLARIDLAHGRCGTAIRSHHAVRLEGLPAFLVPHLDGTNTLADLTAIILDGVNSGAIEIENKQDDNPQEPRPEGEDLRRIVSGMVNRGLLEIQCTGVLDA